MKILPIILSILILLFPYYHPTISFPLISRESSGQDTNRIFFTDSPHLFQIWQMGEGVSEQSDHIRDLKYVCHQSFVICLPER